MNEKRVALITGISGQDGSYLTEFLLSCEKYDYVVHGIIRRSSNFTTNRIDAIIKDPKYRDRLHLHYGDMTDASNLVHLLARIQPDEIYHLAAQSHVKVSFEVPEYTADVNGLGTLRLLEAILSTGLKNKVRFYNAATSELYGLVQETPQTEKTPFYPRSPYAVGKLASFWYTKNYREAYNLFACNGILFNHESPRRGPTFVTRKTTLAVSRIVSGSDECLYLGNLNAMRDWGHARDYVKAMWLMLQHEKPDDFVIATGKTTSVKEFVEKAFKVAGIGLVWKGEGIDEIAVDEKNNERVLVRIDPKYYRLTEVDLLLGDSSKARQLLHWIPETSIDQLIEEMVKSDINNSKILCNQMIKN